MHSSLARLLADITTEWNANRQLETSKKGSELWTFEFRFSIDVDKDSLNNTNEPSNLLIKPIHDNMFSNDKTNFRRMSAEDEEMYAKPSSAPNTVSPLSSVQHHKHGTRSKSLVGHSILLNELR